MELCICIQIRIIHLLIFTEKFLPLPVFEPVTSLVPSRFATNWAFLAWILLVVVMSNLIFFSCLATLNNNRKLLPGGLVKTINVYDSTEFKLSINLTCSQLKWRDGENTTTRILISSNMNISHGCYKARLFFE